MTIKKILFMISLIALGLVCLVSCGNTETTTVPETTEVTPVTAFESLTIAGNELSQYTIVYAESEFVDEAAKYPDYYPVWDFNKETAERVSDLIFEVSGVRLSIACDEETDKGEYEILIGATNRSETLDYSLKAVGSESYKIVVAGKKLAICGGKHGTTWHAIDYVEELLKGELTKGNTAYTFASDFSYKGDYDLIRIGCIGDSITQGVGVDNAAKHSYPAQLGRLLWKDAIVVNYGNSGKTMRSDFKDSFMGTSTFTSALAAASKVDIFTVMLGTNDSNRDQNWTAADTTQFKTDCETMFNKLKSKNSNMQFVIMNCPAYFGNSNFGSLRVRTIQAELVEEMNDKGYKTSFFDMYSVTKSLSQHYPDQLHPNADGHTVMANALGEMLAELIKTIK